MSNVKEKIREIVYPAKRVKGGAGVKHYKNTADFVTERIKTPEKVTLLMNQHIGAPAEIKVKKGDKVVIEANYATFTYEVYDYKVVKETNLKAFEIQQNEERLLMYTCYPINQSVVGRKTKRYVVYAKRVGDISE